MEDLVGLEVEEVGASAAELVEDSKQKNPVDGREIVVDVV